MNDSAGLRSAIILIAGIFAGAVAGFSLARCGRSAIRPEEKSVAIRHEQSAGTSAKHASALLSDDSQVMLGNITTVPFQELYAVLSALPPEKLDELAAQLNKLPDDKQTSAKIATFFKAWAHIDPTAALRAAITFKSAEAKNTAIAAVIDSADVTQAEAFAKAIIDWPEGAVGRGQRNNFLGSAVAKWAQLVPADAAKFYDAAPLAAMRYNWAATAIAQNWAATDPQAALAWAQSHAYGEGLNLAVNGAVTGWWSKDHAAAEAYVVAHLSDQSGRQLVSHLASYMFSRDPERAKQWVNALPDLQARQQSDNMLAIHMGSSDPKGASEWAATLPADVRDSSLRAAVHVWASNDLTAAGEWINGLNGAVRDQAVGAYTNNVLKKNPAAAAAWAMTVNDATIRQKSLERITADWLRRNGPEATAWIQNSALPIEQKQRLLALAPKG